MKTFKYIVMVAMLGLTMTSCYDMDLDQKGVVGENVLMASDNGIKQYFALLYQDLPIEDFNYNHTGADGAHEGYAVNNNTGWHVGNAWDAQKGSMASASFEAVGRGTAYGDGWGYWPYDRIRTINNFIEQFPNYRDNFDTEPEFNEYLGEAYFLRAYYYFGMVKRYGGVPIIKNVQDPTLPPAELQLPRNTEYECWKFIHDDLQFAMENAANKEKYTPGRANRYAAAALMSRAMIYAGSIAKYGGYVPTKGPAVSAGLMTMPADKAQEFFQYAYDACKFIEEKGGYALHGAGVADRKAKEAAYVDIFATENKEDIFVKQYVPMVDAIWETSLYHQWDGMILPVGMIGGGAAGAALVPAWELIKLYEMPALIDAEGKPVRFDRREDLWDNDIMEPRARANFFFSGMQESGSSVVFDIQGGIYSEYPGTAADGTFEIPGSRNDYTDKYRYQGSTQGSYKSNGNIEFLDDAGKPIKMMGNHSTGTDQGDEAYSHTGTYIRKYVNPSAPAASRILFGSTQPWKVFRYGEVLMNWAEAAYELGLLTDNNALKEEAFTHINAIRERAGATSHAMLANPQDIGTPLYGFAIDENLQFIRDERARELCYENHRLFDLRRWRVAYTMFLNGKTPHTITPYYVYNEKKWIFLNEMEKVNRTVTFEEHWYYEPMPGDPIKQNPNLIRNDGY